jgi:hypothetical protein
MVLGLGMRVVQIPTSTVVAYIEPTTPGNVQYTSNFTEAQVCADSGCLTTTTALVTSPPESVQCFWMCRVSVTLVFRTGTHWLPLSPSTADRLLQQPDGHPLEPVLPVLQQPNHVVQGTELVPFSVTLVTLHPARKEPRLLGRSVRRSYIPRNNLINLILCGSAYGTNPLRFLCT